jgi:hypothetical protein
MAKRRRNGRRNNNGAQSGPTKPQSNASILDLSIFPPRRKIMVAAEAIVNNGTATLFGFSRAPSNSFFSSVQLLISSFQASRVIGIQIFFDQRGAAATAAIPRVTAFLATGLTSQIDPTKADLVNLTKYAGSGINQVVPGKSFYLKVGPEFSAGRFDDQSTSEVVVLVGNNYEGTVRLKFIYEVVGIPADISIV